VLKVIIIIKIIPYIITRFTIIIIIYYELLKIYSIYSYI